MKPSKGNRPGNWQKCSRPSETDMAILSSKGVKPEMKFVCCDCTEIISGQQVIEGERLHIVMANRNEPETFVFRCECCHDDWEEKFG
jgi:hypothetical protein